MPRYTQAGRPLRIETPLGNDKLLLVGLEGHEGLSELFHFRLQLVFETASDGQAIRFADILGKPVAVEIDYLDAPRTIHGIVSSFGEGDRRVGFIQYEAEVVPRFWLLQHQVRSRVFQWTTVPGILNQVLAPLRPDFELRLSGTYSERDYCVQYQESDYAFACRLMEEEGMYFFFQHSKNKHTLIVTDDRQQSTDLPERATIEMRQDFRAEKEVRVLHWKKTQRIVAPSYTVRDYHCLAADRTADLQANVTVSASATFGTIDHSLQVNGAERLEVCEFPGGYAKHFDDVGLNAEDKSSDFQGVFQANERYARLRAEGQTAGAFEVSGACNRPHLTPGFKFTLAGHADADGPYLLTRVQHQARDAFIAELMDVQPFDYGNRFECLPASVQYRPPRRTPRPTIAGVQTAVVMSDGGEMTIDKHARVKVKFHWDRSDKSDLTRSCWLRVGQIWAGKKWGAFFWPRQGHEVIVAFCDGDPDRPIIVGSVYNNVNVQPTDPVDKEDHYKVSGIVTKIFGVAAEKARNGIAFYDAKDEEFTQIYSEKNDVQSARVNRFEFVPVHSVEFTGRLPG